MTVLHVTFLRHGRSLADDENVHEGRYDSPLTAVGQAQAAALAAHWQAQGETFDAAACSTLLRAYETAQIVTGVLGVPLTPNPLLMEWDNGPLAGLSVEEALRRYPIPAFRHELDAFTPGGGESQAAIRARALTALVGRQSSLPVSPDEHGVERALAKMHNGRENQDSLPLTA